MLNPVYCQDCGKLLNPFAQYSRTTRCLSCAHKLQRHSPATKAKIAAAHIGKPRSPETKEKLRSAHLGMHPSEETRKKLGHAGEKHPLWGKHHAPETIEKIRLAKIGKKIGPASPFYRHGRGMLPYSSDWPTRKRMIYRRDGGLCQHPDCHIPENGKHHDVHHIDGNKNNNSSGNLILLCRDHHAKTFYGDTDHWMEFYDSVQSSRGIEIAINLGG